MRTRRLHRALVMALVTGTVAAACASTIPSSEVTTPSYLTTTLPPPTTTAPPTTTTLPPQRGGSTVVGVDEAPLTLNPYGEGGDAPVVSLIGQAIHARAWDVDAGTRRIVPDLILEIPTVANGGVVAYDNGTMTVTYRIRPEANWSDGVPVTGDDFAFTAETLAAIDDFRSDPLTGRNLYAEIVATEADTKTFALTMPQTLAYETLFEWLLPRHQVAGTDLVADWDEIPYVGAGPFVVDSFAPGGDVSLVRNDNYWKRDTRTGERLPHLDEVVFRFADGPDALVRAFASGAVDVIEAPAGTDVRGTGIVTEVVPGLTWEHLSFQFGPGRFDRNTLSQNDELELRRAIAQAVDLAALGAVNPDWVPISSYLDVADPELSGGAWGRYRRDVAAAQALLEPLRAEHDGVVRVVFTATSNSEERPRIAQALAPMLAEAGIEFEVQLEDSVAFFGNTLRNGTFDLGLWAWTAGAGRMRTVGMLDLFDPGGGPPNGSNYYRWGTRDSSVRDEHTSRFTEIRRLANDTVDLDEIDRLVVEAEALLADQAVILPFAARASILQWRGDAVTGLVNNPTSAGFTWNIEHWRAVG